MYLIGGFKAKLYNTSDYSLIVGKNVVALGCNNFHSSLDKTKTPDIIFYRLVCLKM